MTTFPLLRRGRRPRSPWGPWRRLEPTIKPVVVIYIVAGFLAVANGLFMDDYPRPRGVVVGLGVVDVLVAIVIARLPWQRWPRRAPVALVPFTLVLIQTFAWADALSDGTYPIFFVLLFIWIGISQPPRTALFLAPLTLGAYLVPRWTGAEVGDVTQSAGLVVPVCILVAEIVSRSARATREAERRAADLEHEKARAVRERDLREQAYENAQRLEAVINQLPGSVWTTDAALRLLTQGGSAPVGVGGGDHLDGDTASPVPPHLAALEGETVAFEAEVHGAVLRGSVAPRRDTDGRIVGTVGVALDVTEEARARDTARLQTALLAESPASTVVTTLDGKVTYWSPASERLFGTCAEEAIGRHVFDLGMLPEDQDLGAEILTGVAAGGKWSGEWKILQPEGDPIWVWTSVTALRDPAGEVTGILVTAVDITERKSLERQLQQTQRLESVGQLAGGVAHDFNNLLAVILSYTELLLADVGPEDPRREDLNVVMDAARKGSALTRQLLTFARREISMPRVLDPNEVVKGMERLLARALDGDVRLEFSCGEVPAVRIDPGQLEQVLMNLAVNANDAMPHGGTVRFETCTVVVDSEFAKARPSLEPGPYAKLSVTDEGVGMPREVRERIFEPFYTTKGPGGGTGLGLPTVHGIVTKAGGLIDVYSEPGLGTTFNIYLPASSAPADEAEAQSWPSQAPQGNGELVLVAEDEDAVRAAIERVLTGAGYRVVTAASGREALAAAERILEPIDLLLTDIVMPHMTGKALAEQLRLRTVFMSGYTQQLVAEKGMLEAGQTLIQKPFAAAALLEVVRGALDSERRTQGLSA